MRPSPTDPSQPAPAVRSGLSPGKHRAKATYSRSDATTGQLGGPRPVPAPQARPRPVPYPGHAPRVVPAPGGRVDPPPQGRVTPPAGNAHPGATYSPPGLAQGYGQGGYAPQTGLSGPPLPDAGYSPFQASQASPLLLALIAAMRGGYGY